MLTNPLLMIDFYKACHESQYPKGLTKMVSYYTPRMSRLDDVDKVTLFGLQGFINEYLIEGFNKYFFERNINEVLNEYKRTLDYTMGEGSYNLDKVLKLHQLGYLPLEIRALPEGTRSNIGVPQIEISNTHPDFVWLVNTIETLLSCTMWHTQVSAEVGCRYRKIVDKYVDLTCENVDPRNVLGDFSMRGQQSAESAIKSSAAWLLSFNNTATVPAIMWLEKNYNCDVESGVVGRGAISTEHSVMCSNFSVDGDEITQVKRLLTEIYPKHSFSMVSDSYDYWNMVTNILPQCKEEIMAHEGYIGIRGDSGNPIEVIAGKEYKEVNDEEFDWIMNKPEKWVKNYFDYPEYDFSIIIKHNEDYYKVCVECEWTNERGAWTDNKYYYVDCYYVKVEEYTPTAEDMGTVWALWQEFGGTVNSKGYKVLDPHVKAIYGDSITPYRCEEIYNRLAEKGFAISNVTLGVGSFSMMCLENYNDETGEFTYSPYTRDTFGIAVKATYAEDADGNPIMIMKQPKDCGWKKSQKGCCIVTHDENGNYFCDDGYTWTDCDESDDNDLVTVFKDGKMVREWNLDGIRTRMYEYAGVMDI